MRDAYGMQGASAGYRSSASSVPVCNRPNGVRFTELRYGTTRSVAVVGVVSVHDHA